MQQVRAVLLTLLVAWVLPLVMLYFSYGNPETGPYLVEALVVHEVCWSVGLRALGFHLIATARPLSGRVLPVMAVLKPIALVLFVVESITLGTPLMILAWLSLLVVSAVVACGFLDWETRQAMRRAAAAFHGLRDLPVDPPRRLTIMQAMTGALSGLAAAIAAGIVAAMIWQLPISWGVRLEVSDRWMTREVFAALLLLLGAGLFLLIPGARVRHGDVRVRPLLVTLLSAYLVPTMYFAAIASRSGTREIVRHGVACVSVLTLLVLAELLAVRARHGQPLRRRVSRSVLRKCAGILAAGTLAIVLYNAVAGPNFMQIYYKIGDHPLWPTRLGLALLGLIESGIAVGLLWQVVRFLRNSVPRRG